MEAVRIARWFVEAAGFAGVDGIDLWALAARWNLTVREMSRRSYQSLGRARIVWISGDATPAAQRLELARGLAEVALDVIGPADPAPDLLERVALHLAGASPGIAMARREVTAAQRVVRLTRP